MCVSWPPVAQWPMCFLSTIFQESNDLDSFMGGSKRQFTRIAMYLEAILTRSFLFYVLWIVTKKSKDLGWGHWVIYPYLPLETLVIPPKDSHPESGAIFFPILGRWKWGTPWYTLQMAVQMGNTMMKHQICGCQLFRQTLSWQTPFVTKLDECYDWNCYYQWRLPKPNTKPDMLMTMMMMMMMNPTRIENKKQ